MEGSSRNSIHHVEIGVSDGKKAVDNFTSKFPFDLNGTREGIGVVQWLLQSKSLAYSSSSICFVFSQVTCEDCIVKDPYSTLWYNKSSSSFQRQLCNVCSEKKENAGVCMSSLSESSRLSVIPDSVFNIALEVNDVYSFTQHLSQNGVSLMKETQTLRDEKGVVDISIVKSVVGNVIHSIINSKNYTGLFLPGFIPVPSKKIVPSIQRPDSMFSHIDHFTFVCEIGDSASIIEWYERHFHMSRFMVNSEEDETEGFVISGTDIGLRMKAMEYWKCAEQGLQSGPKSSVQFFKIVIAEALENQGPNQISTFLSEHKGPGIQHIGLHTANISHAIRHLKSKGVEFAEPPYTYYSEVGRLHDIIGVGLDSAELKELGILIDTEEDEVKDTTAEDLSSCQTKRYLLQKFTKPIFDQDSFFLEVIQRLGATGFGSGNITALWRSVQAYMNENQGKCS